MLSEQEKADYLRAAVALERHEQFAILEPGPCRVARSAFWKVGNKNRGKTIGNIDLEAARLLRECVAKSEPLP